DQIGQTARHGNYPFTRPRTVSTRLASKRPVEAQGYTGWGFRLPEEPLRKAWVRILELICTRVALPLGSTNSVKDTNASPSSRSSPIVPQSAHRPIGVMVSSEEMTPESRATARSGRFSRATGRISAAPARSWVAPIWERKGGGVSGPTWGRPQAVSVSVRAAAMARLPLVVIDPTVAVDETNDTLP